MQNPDAISLAFQVTISCVTLACEYLKGTRWPRVWTLALASQALWLAWIIYAGSWGLLPLTIALSCVFVRNARLWRRGLCGQRPLTFYAAACADSNRSWKACTTCPTFTACSRGEQCFEARFRKGA